MSASGKTIQVFVPTFEVDEVLAEIRECLEKGWTGMGYKTVTFEDAWKAYTGLPHAHFLSSATAGLHLALAYYKMAEGWQDGDEVISTPLTFISTNHAILYERLQPVFADVDEFGCLDPASVAARITPRTRAVMFVGLGGNTGQLPAVAELCRKHGLRLILDAAHMAGTTLNGACPATLADMAVYSFQAVKNLPTADSGMICCADAAADAAIRQLSWLGINKDTYARMGAKGDYKWLYDVEHVGFKYNGNAVMAAMGLVGLRHLDAGNAYRRQLAAWYDEALEDVPEITRLPLAPGCDSSRHLYSVLVPERDAVMQRLYAEGIFPGVHYLDNTRYSMYAAAAGTCLRAAAMSERIISLPMHLRLTQEDAEHVAATLIATVTELAARRAVA